MYISQWQAQIWALLTCAAFPAANDRVPAGSICWWLLLRLRAGLPLLCLLALRLLSLRSCILLRPQGCFLPPRNCFLPPPRLRADDMRPASVKVYARPRPLQPVRLLVLLALLLLRLRLLLHGSALRSCRVGSRCDRGLLWSRLHRQVGV